MHVHLCKQELLRSVSQERRKLSPKASCPKRATSLEPRASLYGDMHPDSGHRYSRDEVYREGVARNVYSRVVYRAVYCSLLHLPGYSPLHLPGYSPSCFCCIRGWQKEPFLLHPRVCQMPLSGRRKSVSGKRKSVSGRRK